MNEIKEEYENKLNNLKNIIKEKEEQFKKELEEIKMKISYKYLILIYILYNSLYNKNFYRR